MNPAVKDIVQQIVELALTQYGGQDDVSKIYSAKMDIGDELHRIMAGIRKLEEMKKEENK